MKYCTVKEFAKKLRVSEGTIYDRIKKGEIEKVPNLGKTVRIPVDEIKKFKIGIKERNYFTYDDTKIDVIETHLGKIRKLKLKDEYVVVDIINALGLKDSYSMLRRLDEKEYRKITIDEIDNLGLYAFNTGLMLITYKGIVQYSKKSRSKDIIDFEKFLEELKPVEKVEFQEQLIIEEVKSTTNLSNLSKMFEGHQVDLIEINGEILFELYTTGIALGYSKTDGKTMSVKGGQKLYPRKERIEAVLGRLDVKPVVKDGQRYLNEQMLYDFMLETRSTQCIKFRKWITNEVLPTIRQTGGYVNNSNKFVDNYFNSFSPEVKQAMINDLESKNKKLVSQREEISKELTNNLDVITKIKETI